MTPPRLVIAGPGEDDTPTPAETFHIDRAPAGAACISPRHGSPVAADIVVIEWDRAPRCRACWGPIGVVLRRQGHELEYTSEALAVWELPAWRSA